MGKMNRKSNRPNFTFRIEQRYIDYLDQVVKKIRTTRNPKITRNDLICRGILLVLQKEKVIRTSGYPPLI